jgi:hypothetical protein
LLSSALPGGEGVGKVREIRARMSLLEKELFKDRRLRLRLPSVQR